MFKYEKCYVLEKSFHISEPRRKKKSFMYISSKKNMLFPKTRQEIDYTIRLLSFSFQ